jgi:hypothetical protein
MHAKSIVIPSCTLSETRSDTRELHTLKRRLSGGAWRNTSAEIPQAPKAHSAREGTATIFFLNHQKHPTHQP